MTRAIKKIKNEELDYSDFTKQLRGRFLKCGPEALFDHELLELILFTSLPCNDIKAVAQRLIARFGTLADIISADCKRLEEVSGVGESVVTNLKVIHAAALTLLRENISDAPVIGSWQAVLEYCRASMAYNKIEQFRVLFLDRKNMLIADEIQQRGTVDHTPVYPREVIKRVLELDASAIILVHNHPSGDPTPSRDDITMTRNIVDAGQKLGIGVHDHVVVGRKGIASFKNMGLL